MQDSRSINKPELLSSNILKIFAPKTSKFRQAEYTEYDSGITVDCPDISLRIIPVLTQILKN